MIEIADRIFYIAAGIQPLSAETGVVLGDAYTWLFDVGNGEASLSELCRVPGRKSVVLSHFHPDHIGNLPQIRYEKLYVGANTAKYIDGLSGQSSHSGAYKWNLAQNGKISRDDSAFCRSGEHQAEGEACRKQPDVVVIVEKNSFTFYDGVRLTITALPSSHAKGSLALTVEDTYTFLGDAAYCTRKAGKAVYNAGVLLEEIRVLECMDTKYFLQSHTFPKKKEKQALMAELTEIYAKRKKNEAYIEVI